jgi:ATP phosphoribosyltransferase regulatory subunit
MNWLLPEYIADALPPRLPGSSACAARCSIFRVRGYELVMPPLLEYLDSLLTGSGQDLKLRTFKLVDQLSGRTHGRACRHDAAGRAHRRPSAQPQGRDAPVLLRQRAAHPAGDALAASREPMQIGAELYGMPVSRPTSRSSA